MRIGIDARTVVNRRGIGNVVYNLLQELAKIPSEHTFVLYVSSAAARPFLPDDKRFTVKVVKPGIYPLWEQVSLPWRAWRDRLDILHCPGNSAPLLLPRKVRLVLSIMDVMFMFPKGTIPASPSLYQRLGRKYLKFVVPRAAKKAHALTTISQTSQDDINRYIDLKGKPVSVIWLAANSDHLQGITAEQTLAALDKLKVAKPFALALGAIDPRKNTTTILQAFAQFTDRLQAPFNLVVTGLKGHEAEAYRQTARSLGIEQRVLFTPFVSEQELGALYNSAEFLVYPSLYEGFGLPVVEAMACGTPVITGRSGSLPEIAGDAALMVNPTVAGEIADAMHQFATSAELRNQFSQLGRQRSALFSWEKMSEAFTAIYESAGRP
jgi:glycosyltransferase involved in cell wall biosynthesis